MIRTVFVPTSGTDTDTAVFASALAVARTLGAHMTFFHLRLSAAEAAHRSPHVQFAMGPAVDDALRHLHSRSDSLAETAIRHFTQFCEANDVPVRMVPGGNPGVSAERTEEADHVEEHLLRHCRHHDLVVIGRPHTQDWMPENLIELLLTRTGRPILIAPDTPPANVVTTVAVGWKETAESARALAAAMPLLHKARRVVLVGAEEAGHEPGTRADLVQLLKWHGIAAEDRFAADDGTPVAARLLQTAAEAGAELLVTGGYGHGPLRETVFGGVTQALIRSAGLPVLMMH